MTLKEKADYIFGIPDSAAKQAWFNIQTVGGLDEAAEIVGENYSEYATKFMAATKSGDHTKAAMLQDDFLSRILSKLVLKFAWKEECKRLLTQAKEFDAIKIMQENGCDISHLEHEAVRIEQSTDHAKNQDDYEELVKKLLEYL